MSVHSFQANLSNGEKVGLDTFKGKVMLIVNTASKCGLTPQYEGLKNYMKHTRTRDLQYKVSRVINLADKSLEQMKRLANFAH